MGKVRYKKFSNSLSKMVMPEEYSGRVSIGLEKDIGEFYYIEVEDLLPFKNQARQHFAQEEIALLAESIAKHGIRHPLTVVACDGEKGKYEVVSGERRLRAAKLIKLGKVPCILLRNKEIATEVAMVENIHRQDLNPVELGNAFALLLQNQVFSSQVELAKKLSISESTVSEYLQYSLLDDDTKCYIIENNVKSREQLRKLVKAQNDKVSIKKILDTRSSNKTSLSFSVIRVLYSEGDLKLQMNGIKKLNSEQRRELKLALQRLVIDLDREF